MTDSNHQQITVMVQRYKWISELIVKVIPIAAQTEQDVFCIRKYCYANSTVTLARHVIHYFGITVKSIKCP